MSSLKMTDEKQRIMSVALKRISELNWYAGSCAAVLEMAQRIATNAIAKVDSILTDEKVADELLKAGIISELDQKYSRSSEHLISNPSVAWLCLDAKRDDLVAFIELNDIQFSESSEDFAKRITTAFAKEQVERRGEGQ